MSYEIVKNINMNLKKETISITLACNNIVPHIFETINLTNNRSFDEALEQICKGYLSGDLQFQSSSYSLVRLALIKCECYKSDFNFYFEKVKEYIHDFKKGKVTLKDGTYYVEMKYNKLYYHDTPVVIDKVKAMIIQHYVARPRLEVVDVD